MNKILVLAETQSGARELCAGARSFAQEVVLVALNTEVAGVADTCYTVDIPAEALIDDAYVTVQELCEKVSPDAVFAEQALSVLSIVGRLAFAYNTAAITGVSQLEGDVASSLYFGGTGMRTARVASGLALYVIASNTFDAQEVSGTDQVEHVAFQAPATACRVVSSEPLPPSEVNLADAEVVVACGRGFAAEEDLTLARELATKLGGEVGCTRPLAEGAGWFSREAYIGVSGAMVAPRIYVALGISGQMQHMVGCASSECVIAVNKDKNAPIFKQCDLGLVGDLKAVLPALTQAL